MYLRAFGFVLLGVASAALASAETKVTGTLKCGEPSAEQALPAGDQPGHIFSVSSVPCTWSSGMEIAGSTGKDGTSTGASEITGGTYKGHGQHVTTMSSGDKYYVAYKGSGTVKDGVVQTGEGTWSFTGGTGKLAGIKGEGTYKGKLSADGGLVYEVEGTYELAK
jgi:hypothetical protein